MYAKLLAESWREQNERQEELEHSVAGTSMRHSMAGKCARQIHYYLSKTEPSNPFDLPSVWVMGLGSRIHLWWQDSLRAAFPTAEVEVTTHLEEADSSGHIDATIQDGDKKIALELKSINGFGFKRMAEMGDGPRYGDTVQLAMNAYGCGADEAVLIYLSTEAVSRARAKSKGLDEHERIMKEFHFDRQQIVEIAEAEMARWARIRKAGDKIARLIPDPEYPPAAEVVDPKTGRMAIGSSTTGYAWQCNYCSYQNKCAEDKAAGR